MKLICIVMGLGSLALMLGLVITVLAGEDSSGSGDAPDGVDAGAAGTAE